MFSFKKMIASTGIVAAGFTALASSSNAYATDDYNFNFTPAQVATMHSNIEASKYICMLPGLGTIGSAACSMGIKEDLVNRAYYQNKGLTCVYHEADVEDLSTYTCDVS